MSERLSFGNLFGRLVNLVFGVAGGMFVGRVGSRFFQFVADLAFRTSAPGHQGCCTSLALSRLANGAEQAIELYLGLVEFSPTLDRNASHHADLASIAPATSAGVCLTSFARQLGAVHHPARRDIVGQRRKVGLSIDETHATPAAISIRAQRRLARWALEASGQDVMAMGINGFKKHLRLDLYPSHIPHAARGAPAAPDSCIFADTSLRRVAVCLLRLTDTGGRLDVYRDKKKYERLQRITPSHVGKDVSGLVPHDRKLYLSKHATHARYPRDLSPCSYRFLSVASNVLSRPRSDTDNSPSIRDETVRSQ